MIIKTFQTCVRVRSEVFNGVSIASNSCTWELGGEGEPDHVGGDDAVVANQDGRARAAAPTLGLSQPSDVVDE